MPFFTTEEKRKIVARLTAYRNLNALTQNELAVKMGISTRTISLWETQDHDPSDRLALKALEFLAEKEYNTIIPAAQTAILSR